MDTTTNTPKTEIAIKTRPEGVGEIVSKAESLYPLSAEWDCQRAVRHYYRLLELYMKSYIDPLVKEYKESTFRTDAADKTPFQTRKRRTLSLMMDELEKALEYFGIEKRVEKISKLTRAHTIREWRKAVKETLGIEVAEKYYKGGIFEQIRKQWVQDNVQAIRTSLHDSVDQVVKLMTNPENESLDFIAMVEQIRDEYFKMRDLSVNMSSDQVSTLDTALTRSIHQDAGVENYVWISKRDDLVRQSHRAFDGKVFSWNSPPDGWYVTKSKGLILTGRRCHPGEDYGCRCRAKPVFNFSLLNIPITGSIDYEKQREPQSVHKVRKRKSDMPMP